MQYISPNTCTPLKELKCFLNIYDADKSFTLIVDDNLIFSQFKLIQDEFTCHEDKWAAAWQNQQNDCAHSEDRSAWASAQSDQSSLCDQWVAKDPSFSRAEREDSDPPSLIRVFAGRICHFVGFVMGRLKSVC